MLLTTHIVCKFNLEVSRKCDTFSKHTVVGSAARDIYASVHRLSDHKTFISLQVLYVKGNTSYATFIDIKNQQTIRHTVFKLNILIKH